MAAGPLIRQVTVNAAGATRNGTLSVTAPAAGAKIVGIFVRNQASVPEFALLGVTLSDTAATAATIQYSCAGLSGATYPVVLTVSDSDTD